MASPVTTSALATYLTKHNIVHPEDEEFNRALAVLRTNERFFGALIFEDTEEPPPPAPDDLAPVSQAVLDPASPGNGGLYATAVTVTLSASDNEGGSGVDRIEYRINGGSIETYTDPFVVSAQGLAQIEYRAVDEEENAEDFKMVSFTIDSIAPTSSLDTDPVGAGPYNQAVEITLSADDDGGSGVDRIEYQLNAGSVQTYASPFSVSLDGEHELFYRAIDEAGNVETWQEFDFTIDKTAPNSSISLNPASPGPNGDYAVNVELTINSSDLGGTGVVSREYRINGGSIQTYTSPFTVSAEGEYTIEYRATDQAGNVENFKSVSFEIDKTAPESTIVFDPASPGDGGNYNVNVEFTINATDGGSGVVLRQYRIDGGSIQTYSGPFAVSTEGQHTVEYRATDAAGNVESFNEVDLRIDKTAPVTTASFDPASPGNGGTYEEPVEITLNASDSGGSGVDDTEVNVNSAGFVPYTAPIEFDENDTYVVQFRSTDLAGNTESTKQATFDVDIDAGPTYQQHRFGGFETNDFSEFAVDGGSGFSETSGDISIVTTGTPHTGTHMAECTIDGNNQNGFARTQWTVANFGEGDSFSWRCWYFIDSQFVNDIQGEVALLRWDTFPTNDRGGFIYDHTSDMILYRHNSGSGGSTTGLFADFSFAMPTNQWVELRLDQTLSTTPGVALTEAYVNGSPVASSDEQNFFGNAVTRFRNGIVAMNPTSQSNPLTLWIDDVEYGFFV